MSKQELLAQVDQAILNAPTGEVFKYVPGYGTKARQLWEFHRRRLNSQGQVELTGFKVLNDKVHLKWFKKEINRNFTAKKRTETKQTALPSVKSCILRLIKDEDSDSYHSNIFHAAELHPGKVFYGHGTPYLIDSELIVAGRKLVVVNGLEGWDVLDVLTAMSIVGNANKPTTKNKGIKIAKQNCENYDFNRGIIKTAELMNTQANLKEKYRKLHAC